MLGGIVIGFFVGGFLVWAWLDREGLKDSFRSGWDSAMQHAPSGEQTVSATTAVVAFARRNWVVLLIVVALLIWGIWTLVQQANQVPSINLGFNTLKDRCGLAQVVNVTVEDVRRGQVVVGTTPDCRRIINLKPAN